MCWLSSNGCQSVPLLQSVQRPGALQFGVSVSSTHTSVTDRWIDSVFSSVQFGRSTQSFGSLFRDFRKLQISNFFFFFSSSCSAIAIAPALLLLWTLHRINQSVAVMDRLLLSCCLLLLISFRVSESLSSSSFELQFSHLGFSSKSNSRRVGSLSGSSHLGSVGPIAIVPC